MTTTTIEFAERGDEARPPMNTTAPSVEAPSEQLAQPRALLLATGSEWRACAERRFHELVVKRACGRATTEDRKKLDRYQALRRSYLDLRLPAAEQARIDWKDRQALKALRRLMHELKASPNVKDEPRGRKET